MAQLKEGDQAPAFTATDQNGKNISLSDFKGKKIILYFYPKDDTPGCTAEACNLRDNYADLTAKGFVVIGVSPDDEKSHQRFIGKFILPFLLLADKEKQILSKYEAWGEKISYGIKSVGVLRKTYIIDERGIIAHIITKVDTKEHTQQIFNELKTK